MNMPTTDQVHYKYWRRGGDEIEFDRWLAEHDRQVAERAWGGSGNALVTWLANDLRSEPPTNPYSDVVPSAPTLATEGS